MIYNWHTSELPPEMRGKNYRATDAATGHEVPFVFYYDTETKKVGRYAVDTNGNVMLSFGPGATKPGEVWETRELVFAPVAGGGTATPKAG
jgi:hypothetical protein